MLDSEISRNPVGNTSLLAVPVSYTDLGLSPVFGKNILFVDVYLDESMGRDSEPTLAAGLVSNTDRWAVFSSEWKTEILDRFKIPELHMRRFRPENRIYKHLSQDDFDEILAIAVRLIIRHVSHAVISELSPREYDSIAAPEHRRDHGTAYTLAVLGCVRVADATQKLINGDSTLNIILEDGHKNAMQAMIGLQDHKKYISGRTSFALLTKDISKDQIFHNVDDEETLKLGSIGLATRSAMLPLQASDFLAYCWLNRANAKYHAIIDAIREGLPLFPYQWIKEDFIEQVQQQASLEAEEAKRKLVTHRLSRFLGNFGGRISHVQGGLDIFSGDVYEVLPVNNIYEVLDLAMNLDISVSRPKSPSTPCESLTIVGLPELFSPDSVVDFLKQTEGYIDIPPHAATRGFGVLHCATLKPRLIIHLAKLEIIEPLISAGIVVSDPSCSTVERYRLHQSSSC